MAFEFQMSPGVKALSDEMEAKYERLARERLDKEARRVNCIHHEQVVLIPNPAYETATHELIPPGIFIERRLV